MKLFDGRGAPSPRKVRIFLAEKGIEVERIVLDLRQDEQLQPAYLALNPRGTVPALVLDDGTVIDESSAICRYFEALHPEPNLFGRDAVEIGLIDAWTRRIETDCYAAIVNVFRNSVPVFRDRGISGKWPPLPQIPELVTRGRIMFNSFAEAADSRLGKSAFIACDRYSFADITLQIALDFAKFAGIIPGENLVNLARWRSETAQRESASA